jgi:alpha-mannosidase
MSWDQGKVSARLRLTFDPSPLIRWQIDLDSRGTDFRVDIVFETGHPGEVYAGMPFDVVRRPTVDRDLLPRRLEGSLAAVLLGQRELGATETFPFQDFLAISDGAASAVVLAKGLHAYQADGKGRLTLTLRRAVEWLTKPDLENRVGDAGPFFYVPDARCERSVTHELAAAFVDFGPEDPQLQALNAGFQNPPLLVDSHTAGTRTGWQFFQEPLPLSSLHIADGRVLARVFNPASRPQRLSQALTQTDVSGRPLTTTLTEIPPKSIVTLAIAETPAEIRRTAASGCPADSRVELVNAPTWRVGPNQGRPDPAIIAQLKDRIASLERKVEEAEAQLSQAAPQERYHWQHRIYVLQREQLEYRLSARLNEIKLALQGQITHETLYQPDEEIDAIGRQLNALRIKRRIYDYIVQAV